MRRTLTHIAAFGAGIIIGGGIAHSRSVIGAYHRFAPMTAEHFWTWVLITQVRQRSRRGPNRPPFDTSWVDLGDKPPLDPSQFPRRGHGPESRHWWGGKGGAPVPFTSALRDALRLAPVSDSSVTIVPVDPSSPGHMRP